MNRTGKRFFKKIGVGLLNLLKYAGIWAAIAIPIWLIVFLSTSMAAFAFLVATLSPLFVGLVWFILKDVWDDARDEVELENKRMMAALKGKGR
jgi:hypothetical protein